MRKKILIMDDEEILRETLKAMAEVAGFEADVAENGEKALDLYRRSMDEGQKYSAVILDLTVATGMGGVETLKHLRNMDPDIKAIAISGYSVDDVMNNYERYGFKAAISKPFKIEDLKNVFKALNLYSS